MYNLSQAVSYHAHSPQTPLSDPNAQKANTHAEGHLPGPTQAILTNKLQLAEQLAQRDLAFSHALNDARGNKNLLPKYVAEMEAAASGRATSRHYNTQGFGLAAPAHQQDGAEPSRPSTVPRALGVSAPLHSFIHPQSTIFRLNTSIQNACHRFPIQSHVSSSRVLSCLVFSFPPILLPPSPITCYGITHSRSAKIQQSMNPLTLNADPRLPRCRSSPSTRLVQFYPSHSTHTSKLNDLSL